MSWTAGSGRIVIDGVPQMTTTAQSDVALQAGSNVLVIDMNFKMVKV